MTTSMVRTTCSTAIAAALAVSAAVACGLVAFRRGRGEAEVASGSTWAHRHGDPHPPRRPPHRDARRRQNPRRPWPMAFALVAAAWLWPVGWSIGLVSLHPLLALVFLDAALGLLALRDAAAIVLANLASFGLGELMNGS